MLLTEITNFHLKHLKNIMMKKNIRLDTSIAKDEHITKGGNKLTNIGQQ